MTQTNSFEAILGTRDNSPWGVVEGLLFPKPASGLTVTYLGGVIRLQPTGSTSTPGSRVGREFKIANSTQLFTATRDTYVYIDSAGAIQISAQTVGAAKPTLASLSADTGQFLWKVVTDGSNVTSVTDLRQFAPAWIETLALGQGSYVTATQGATLFWSAPYRCRILKAYDVVAAAVAATDAGTVTFARAADGTSANIAGLVLTNALSSAVAAYAEAIPTLATNPEFAPGDQLVGTTAKTTTGGAVNVYVTVERLS